MIPINKVTRLYLKVYCIAIAVFTNVILLRESEREERHADNLYSHYVLEQSVGQRVNEGYMYLYSVEELSELYICHMWQSVLLFTHTLTLKTNNKISIKLKLISINLVQSFNDKLNQFCYKKGTKQSL